MPNTVARLIWFRDTVEALTIHPTAVRADTGEVAPTVDLVRYVKV